MILEHAGISPEIDGSVFVAPNATIIGRVKIGKESSIWYNAVIRGDIESVTIGERSNIQDFCMVHVPDFIGVEVGDDVTVGHRVTVHGCKIGNNCLIGMGAIIMDNAEIGDNCIIGAGSLVTQGTNIPSGSMAFGSPAKVKREVSKEEIEYIAKSAGHYYEYSRTYMK